MRGIINLHARQCVDGRDRRQLERLCRYVTRPPVAQDRLEQRPDGRLELTLESVWKDGTRAIILEPQDLVVRLIAAIPPPRFHTLRYFGVLSSHSSLRAEVVPHPPPDPSASRAPPASGDQLELLGNADSAGNAEGPRRKRWAWLLYRCAGSRRPPRSNRRRGSSRAAPHWGSSSCRSEGDPERGARRFSSRRSEGAPTRRCVSRTRVRREERHPLGRPSRPSLPTPPPEARAARRSGGGTGPRTPASPFPATSGTCERPTASASGGSRRSGPSGSSGGFRSSRCRTKRRTCSNLRSGISFRDAPIATAPTDTRGNCARILLDLRDGRVGRRLASCAVTRPLRD